MRVCERCKAEILRKVTKMGYGICPTASAAELEHQMRDGGAKLLVAENQEYVDKVLPLAPRLTDLVAIVVIDPTAMFAYDDARLV